MEIHHASAYAKLFVCHSQRQANPNPDLDLNLDLTTFPNPAGFGFDFKMFKSVDLDLDLSFFRELDLDLKIAGFEFFKSTNPATKLQVDTNFSTGAGWTVSVWNTHSIQ